MLDFWGAIILAGVEGVTEFLPISSTGHLILTTRLLGITATDFIKSFQIAIQLGAILSVVVLYWRMFLNKAVMARILVAFLPTAAVGLLLYPFIRGVLFDNSVVVVWAMLLGGLALIIFELGPGRKIQPTAKNLNYKEAFWVGTAQALAVIPGVSRSAATILGGLWLGLDRKTIVEFSFLLAVPTLLAATGLDLFRSAGEFSYSQWWLLLVGFAVSFALALLTIRFLLAFIKHRTFIGFGVYRIIVAVIFLIFILR